MGSPFYKEETNLKVSLKLFPTTIKETADYPKNRGKFVATLTANVHWHVIKKIRSPVTTGKPIKYQKYNTYNNFVLIVIDPGLV